MIEHKLELKINKEADGSSINLDALSVTATQSLIVLLQSITQIIELTPNSSGITIQVKKGSATILADTSPQQLEAIENSFNEVVTYKSNNRELIDSWKKIQSIVKANGLEYEINFIRGQNKRPVTEFFKQRKRFSISRNASSKDYDLIFLKGKLNAVGGTKPSIKLLTSGAKLEIISCHAKQAVRITKLLYSNVFIAVWRKKVKVKGSNDKFFCDSYIDSKYFDMFNAFFLRNQNHEDISDYFVAIHYQMKELLDVGDFPGVKKFMRLFNHASSSVGELKTILIITKSFQQHPDLIDMREEIKELLESKLGNGRLT